MRNGYLAAERKIELLGGIKQKQASAPACHHRATSFLKRKENNCQESSQMAQNEDFFQLILVLQSEGGRRERFMCAQRINWIDGAAAAAVA